jgi:hypothetical protein
MLNLVKNKKRFLISLFVIFVIAFILLFYALLITKIDGTYTCIAYVYLDGGESESFIIFNNNEIFHQLKEPNGSGFIKKIGTYRKSGLNSIIIEEYNFGIKFSATSGIIGLYVDENDAKRLNLNFPAIGNVLYMRSIW